MYLRMKKKFQNGCVLRSKINWGKKKITNNENEFDDDARSLARVSERPVIKTFTRFLKF